MEQLAQQVWVYVLTVAAVVEGIRRTLKNREEIAKAWFWLKKNVFFRNEHERLRKLENESSVRLE